MAARRTRHRIAIIAGTLTGVVSTVLTGLLIALTVSRARLPYENGRYFDPRYSVVYDESAVTLCALMALLAALFSAVVIFGTLRLRKMR